MEYILTIPGIGETRPRCPLCAASDHTDRNIPVSRGKAFLGVLESMTPSDIQKSQLSLLPTVSLSQRS